MKFSFVENYAGTAHSVTRQLFHEIIARESVRKTCEQIAQQVTQLKDPLTTAEQQKRIQDEIGRLKRSLPAFCWHAWFDDGKRSNSCAHPSGLIMLDVDHVEQPAALFEALKTQFAAPVNDGLYLQGHRLMAAHITPSTQGLRLVFDIPSNQNGGSIDLVKAQTEIVNDLRLSKVDVCTKDLARLSFCVPTDYWLYIDEALFEDATTLACHPEGAPATEGSSPTPEASSPTVILSEAKNLSHSDVSPTKDTSSEIDRLAASQQSETKPSGSQKILPPLSRQDDKEEKSRQDDNNGDGRQDDNNGANVPDGNHASCIVNRASEESNAAGTLTTNPSSLTETFEESFNGLPYTAIVQSLCDILGGEPEHGSRNNFIFAMAAYLRYVCNDDAEWIAQILPTYGEERDKWKRTIESACQRAQSKVMPNIVTRALQNARRSMQETDENNDSEDNSMPPAMPKRLPKLIAHLVKNVPEVCRPAVANAVFPPLAIHLKGVKFWLIDGTEKEATFMCVTMAKQSSGKSSVNKPIEYIVADIVKQDELNRQREQEWKDATAQKGANKEKPKRPEDLCVQVLVSDMTNAAFVQRMKDANGKYLYTNLEELELLKQLQTNGTKDIGKIICLCFDNGKYGQERVGTQSVTARVDLRWNWNASTTIRKGLKFFDGRLTDGTLSRINFCTVIPDKTKRFIYGRYDNRYAEELKPYITNLNLATGNIECKEALRLAQKMLEQCQDVSALTDDEAYQDLAYRAVTIAYLKAMVLYIANGMKWSHDIAQFAEWSLKYDLWCKCHFFGLLMRDEKEKENIRKRPGRKNLLDLLPTSFTLKDASEVRQGQGLSEDARPMIYIWQNRGYIEKDPTLNRFLKTQSYLKRSSV